MDYLPLIKTYASDIVQNFWHWILPLVYENILGYEDQLVLNPTGSGDRVVDYLFFGVNLLLAIILTTGSFLFRIEEKKEQKVFSYLIVALRYYLAFNMFIYGLLKIFYLQFVQLSMFSLEQTFGNSSPMGLLWRFMGYSEPYTIFAGALELLGGLLLIWRRTKILGGIMCFGVMLNVFVLNLAYDVPVKLFSFHLTIISLVVLLPDYSNLAKLFIKNRPTVPNLLEPYFKVKKKEITRLSLKYVLVGIVLISWIKSDMESQSEYGKRAPIPTLYGAYDVQLYTSNSDTLLNKTSTSFNGQMIAWKSLLIDKGYSRVIQYNGENNPMKHELDTLNQTFNMISFSDTTKTYSFNYAKYGDRLNLDGIINADTVCLELIRKDRKDYFIENRGFHWINDYPLNR
ncbi:hypothetical protein Musp01_00310 [Muricauda sp. NBRC 101325]|nr:hypothetical protein Musp01_00310 [Muricauda sp. NBRC 101325]